MNSKFTIDSTTDGSVKLYEAIAGNCIVDVLVNGVPIEEVDLSSDFRSVTLKMSNGTEVEFKSKSIDPYTGKVIEYDDLMDVSLFATGEIVGKRVIAAWVDYVTEEDTYGDVSCWSYKTLRVLADGFHRPMTLINTEYDTRDEGPLMFVEIREKSQK